MAELADFKVDAENGWVIGLRGKPITKKVRGYVLLWRNGRETKVYVMAHRLIWERVNGPIPEGMQINHINGIKHDNRIANLELVTPSENLRHAYALGLTSAKGDKNGRAIAKKRAAGVPAQC